VDEQNEEYPRSCLRLRLARWQRILSRRQYGGSNWNKGRLRVARIHEKIVNARRDFLHNLSTKLIRKNQVRFESEEYAQESQPGEIHYGYGCVVAMLEYKAAWYGRILLKVDW
jgi:putative transposase